MWPDSPVKGGVQGYEGHTGRAQDALDYIPLYLGPIPPCFDFKNVFLVFGGLSGIASVGFQFLAIELMTNEMEYWFSLISVCSGITVEKPSLG